MSSSPHAWVIRICLRNGIPIPHLLLRHEKFLSSSPILGRFLRTYLCWIACLLTQDRNSERNGHIQRRSLSKLARSSGCEVNCKRLVTPYFKSSFACEREMCSCCVSFFCVPLPYTSMITIRKIKIVCLVLSFQGIH